MEKADCNDHRQGDRACDKDRTDKSTAACKSEGFLSPKPIGDPTLGYSTNGQAEVEQSINGSKYAAEN